MHFALKTNVRLQLTLTILFAILVSWIASTGISNYLTYRQYCRFYYEMVANPDLYPNPMPRPLFGARELLLGYPPKLPKPANSPVPQPSPVSPPRPQPLTPEQVRQQQTAASLTALIALMSALLTGAWASRRFTCPISELMTGVRAISSGNFEYRIDLAGDDEFSQLATTLNGMSRNVSEQIAQLEREAQMRRHFIADIAHEFKTPITTLKTMAGALEEGIADDHERRQRAARSIVRTSDRLLRLVTDMLDLAKLDLHELPLHQQPVDLRELASSCVQSHATSAESAHVTLCSIEAGAPVMADVDPDRLAQVLDNLISNAISYAGETAIITITISDTPPWHIGVSDTGRGIPHQALPFITEPFYRLDQARAPREAHSGLGLRIAKALVEAHGGTLTIDSVEGQGTTVLISIPQLR